MQLSEKVSGEERSLFVGRITELETMRKHVYGEWKWQWLHIYGQSGLGKSSLLKRFESEWQNDNCYYIDGSKMIRQEEDVLEQIAEQLRQSGERDVVSTDADDIAERINRRARLFGGPPVLLIDAFDNWRSVEHWFTQWLGELDERVRIVTAGRNPLTGGWLRSGWARLIHTMQLSALTPLDVEQYARKRGITGRETHSQLFRFCRGIPLAMTLAAEVMLRDAPNKRFNREEQYHLIAVLMDELLRGLPSSVHRLFEAASVFWRFNEERLAAVIEENIDAESFRTLVGMPFVLLKEDGWMLHEAVRAWSLQDLMRRKPNTYEQMRRKALQQIRREEQANPMLRHKLQLDKMSLHENPIVRDMCFSGHLDDVEVRACRESDLDEVESLYLRYHRFASDAAAGEPHMSKLIRKVWQVDPSSFINIWKQNELVATVAKIPLHDRMLEVLATEPLLQPFVRGWKPAPKSYLLSFIGIDPELEDKTRAYIINTLISLFSPSEWILDFTCLKEWFPVFELCGFDPAPWADAVSEYGTEYRAFVLDLRKEDFLTKLDRMLTNSPGVQTANGAESSPDVSDLKKMLRHWTDLPRNPAWPGIYGRLFPHRMPMGGEMTGQAVQQDLLGAINRLAAGDEREALLGRLLGYTYIQGIRPHERVAERLGVSPASYYRYLNKALEILYRDLARK